MSQKQICLRFFRKEALRWIFVHRGDYCGVSSNITPVMSEGDRLGRRGSWTAMQLHPRPRPSKCGTLDLGGLSE